MNPHRISEYLREFSDRLFEVRVSDRRGRAIPFERGAEHVLTMLSDLKRRSRKLMLIGNGGSAAIASHQALDFWKGGGLPALTFNDPAHLTCVGNDFGYENVFAKPAQIFAQKGDVLVAISSSGRSPSILRGVSAARKKGCRVLTFSGFSERNPLRSKGDLNFYVASRVYGHVELAHLALIHALADIFAHAGNHR